MKKLRCSNKHMRSLMSLLIVLAIVFANTYSVFASENLKAPDLTNIQNDRLYEVFTDKFYETTLIAGKGYDNKIVKIKDAVDFDGNKYLVAEAFPAGYMIYNVETGTFSERSPISVSPFINVNSNLYYGGIGNYFKKDGDKFINMLDTSIVLNAKQIQENNYRESSASLQNYYKAKPYTYVLNYINKGDDSLYSFKKNQNIRIAISDFKERKDKQITSINSTTTKSNNMFSSNYAYFSVVDWFENLKQCGYISGGKCGFIALSMVWAAHDRINASRGLPRWVNDNCYYNNYSSLNTTLSTQMYNLDPKDSTTSLHIEKVSKKYAANKGISIVKHENWLAPFANWTSVANKLNSTGYPVIIFGNYTGVGAHAVVGYYTPPAKNYIICHMGYNNQSYALWEGAIGSYYYLNRNDY